MAHARTQRWLISLALACAGCAEDRASVEPASLDAGSGLIDASLSMRMDELGPLTKLSGSFWFTEGPVWDPARSVLYFTDIEAPQPDGGVGAVYTWAAPNKFELFYQPTGRADGLALDAQQNLVVAGYGSNTVWQLSANKARSLLAPCMSDGGLCAGAPPLNTPDDVAVRSDGTIYFTDPTFGQSASRSSLGAKQRVYRLTRDGVLHVEDESMGGPNGVSFSPDEQTLYVSYSTAGTISSFRVAADGSLSNKAAFATALTPDSMCVDAQGNVYVATLLGVSIFSPAGGTALGTIAVPGDVATNCAFGGVDQKTLFITSHTAVTLVTSAKANTSSLSAIQNMPIPGIAGRN